MVYEACRSWTSNHDHKFENTFVHEWEADLFSVTTTPYSYEIEVKVSRSDFFADFKKPKHRLFKRHKNPNMIIERGRGYERIEGEYYPYTNIEIVPLNGSLTPNKFYYACPDALIDPSEIPDYAGLLYVSSAWSGGIREIKKAPFLHKEKFPIEKMLFSKYYYGYINQKIEMRDMQRDLKRYKELYDDTVTEITKKITLPV